MSLGDFLRDSLHDDGLPIEDALPAKWPRPEVLTTRGIPLPMHGVAPRVLLGQLWWDMTRRAAYRSTDYHCTGCGVYQSDVPKFRRLEGHELYRINYRRGRMTYLETVPLCYWCHAFIHLGRTHALMERGEIPHKVYLEVVRHGRMILARAGLSVKPSHTGKQAPWKKWRLVLFGKEYPPKYPSLAAWCDAWGYEYDPE